ncbi:MAG: SGNH/GDSL hydrolase family protein, partial [Solirubrobacterales bacterium]|nr:SGNH/GDSL hydrolase family protein [Solirubrobacterales bacterium]
EAAGTYTARNVADDTAAPLALVFLGDSSACGLGATKPVETPGAQLALGISAVAERPVRLHSVAAVGARSEHLDDQVSAALCQQPRPNVAVILIGVNDITHLRMPDAAAALLAAALRRLRDAGAAAVVGTCPDLGMVQPIPQPLRSLAGLIGRQLAAAQTMAAVEAGAR